MKQISLNISEEEVVRLEEAKKSLFTKNTCYVIRFLINNWKKILENNTSKDERTQEAQHD